LAFTGYFGGFLGGFVAKILAFFAYSTLAYCSVNLTFANDSNSDFKKQVKDQESSTEQDKIINQDKFKAPLKKTSFSDTSFDGANPELNWSLIYRVKLGTMNKIINLDDAKDMSLEIRPNANGYYVEKSYHFKAGLGPKTSKYFQNFDLNGQGLKYSLGLMPIKSRNVTFTKFVDTLEDAQNLERRELPEEASDLKDWEVGESLNYESSGGVVFAATTKLYYLKVGTVVSAESNWRVEIKKLEGNKAYINMSEAKIKSAAIFGGAGFVSISATKLKESGLGFSYLFDLSDEESSEAFSSMLAGNMIKAQKLSELPKNPKVKVYEQYKYYGKSKSGGLFFGIPYFNLSKASGSYTQHTDVEDFIDNKKITNEYSLFAKVESSKVLKTDRNFSRTFIGGISLIDDLKTKKRQEILTAKLNWTDENEKTSLKDLEKSLARFKKETLSSAFDKVILPSEKQNLFYTQVAHEMELSKELVDLYAKDASKLAMGLAESAKKSLAIESHTADFKKNHCDEQVMNTADSKNFTAVAEGLNQCLRRLENDIEKSAEKFVSHSQDFASALGSKNYPEFAKTLSKIGKVFWDSPFILKALWEKNKKCGGREFYEISGEVIPRVRIDKNYKLEKSSCRL
jgi:hypothetical protein